MEFTKAALRGLASVFVLALVALPAGAEHNDPGYNPGFGRGSYGQVVYQASRLHDVVQYSWLNSNVKFAVSRFQSAAQQLRFCGGRGSWYPYSHQIGTFEHGSGGNCSWAVNEIRRAWSPVERFLYDTSYDFPQVYSEYQRTRSALWRAGLL